MNDLFVDLLWWLLASPIMFAEWAVRMVRRLRFWKMAYTPEILCGNCGVTERLPELCD
jgi:hypothetical protein